MPKVTKMWENCDICKSDFELAKHDTGLVLNDRHFVCSDCCKDSNHDIHTWVQSKSYDKTFLRPIHVWLIENRTYR